MGTQVAEAVEVILAECGSVAGGGQCAVVSFDDDVSSERRESLMMSLDLVLISVFC